MKNLHRKLLFSIVFLCYFVSPLIAQDQNNRITWTDDYRIKWTDFKAAPDYSDRRIAAITSSLIQYRYHCDNGFLKFDSKAIFVCNESWVKPENMNLRTLEHERLHFDITEFFNRMLLKKVTEKVWTCSQVDELEALINDVLDEWRAAQLRYDKDTWFSLNSYMQNEWNNLVKKNLENYE